MARTEIVVHLDPKPEPHPDRYTYTDPDGDRLLITTALIPGHGPGVYFRTDLMGSAVPLADLPALIAQLHVIGESAKADADTDADPA